MKPLQTIDKEFLEKAEEMTKKGIQPYTYARWKGNMELKKKLEKKYKIKITVRWRNFKDFFFYWIFWIRNKIQ